MKLARAIGERRRSWLTYLACAGFLLLTALGALCVFVACEGRFEWQTSAAVAALFAIALAAVPAVTASRLAADARRIAKERDEALQRSAQSEMALNEVQHRIGNHLSVVSAMLSIQGRQFDDHKAKRAIEEAGRRIRVMAEINSIMKAITSEETRIDDIFIGELVSKCIAAAGVENRVRIETLIKPVYISKELLPPLALIINECVTNTIEHGFPDEFAESSPFVWTREVKAACIG